MASLCVNARSECFSTFTALFFDAAITPTLKGFYTMKNTRSAGAALIAASMESMDTDTTPTPAQTPSESLIAYADAISEIANDELAQPGVIEDVKMALELNGMQVSSEAFHNITNAGLVALLRNPSHR